MLHRIRNQQRPLSCSYRPISRHLQSMIPDSTEVTYHIANLYDLMCDYHNAGEVFAWSVGFGVGLLPVWAGTEAELSACSAGSTSCGSTRGKGLAEDPHWP